MYYLASPYNHESEGVRQKRYEANVRVLADLLHSGKITFSPIVHHHPVAVLRDLGRGFEFWRKVDVEYLKRCDVLIVLMLDGWQEAIGVKKEIDISQTLGMPIQNMEADSIIKQIGSEIIEINTANGWNVTKPEDWQDTYKVPGVLALIHSEVSEALEAFRIDDKAHFEEELADVFIRLLDCSTGLGLDLESAVKAKMAKNRQRAFRHGGKRL